MAEATLWSNETGLDLSGLINAGDKAHVLISAEQELQGAEVVHDSLECTLEMHDIQPNDETATPAAPVYNITLLCETRANATAPWTPAVWTTGKLKTPGHKHVLQLGPDQQEANISIGVAGEEIGSRDIESGYLQKFFRFLLVVKTDEGALNPGMLSSADVSLSYTTFQANA